MSTEAPSFFRHLEESTAPLRSELFQIPFVRAALAGRIALSTYRAFLSQAYHHVRFTVPLLMATGAELPERLGWLRDATAAYIQEELGHEEWILSDLSATGADAGAVRTSEPELPCELLVSYAWDVVRRGNPVGFFGMVHVLEGTSVRAASEAARAIQRALLLPDLAFSYLRSHGALDQSHVALFVGLMDRLDREEDRAAVLHCARVFYRLYGDLFRALPLVLLEEGAAPPLDPEPLPGAPTRPPTCP